MQKKLNEGKLLDLNGNLIEAGYAFSLVKDYQRRDIKAKKSRIKEWDYYYIGNDEYGIALTIDDNSYMSLAGVSVLNFKEKCEYTKNIIGWFSNGKVLLPSSSAIGDVQLEGKGFSMKFYNDGKKRRLVCNMKNVSKGKDFSCDVVLDETNDSSMVIAIPFLKEKHFYYNQKINCLKAKGSFSFSGKNYSLDNALGVLDWGRGVWTYKNTWYWASMNAFLNQKPIGFNLGYGFGDTSAASENMFFYDNKGHKLDDIIFEIQKKDGHFDYLAPWKIYDEKKTIDMTFEPILDRHADTNVLIIRSNQHQVFGRFSGYVLIDQQKIEFKQLIGFAERVYNKW